MTQLTVISRERHTDKRWKRNSSYSFAATKAVAPLVMQELPRASITFPVGFVRAGKAFQLVAVQGLQPNKNLWVAADGRWLGDYVPAVYRSHPFVLAGTEDDRSVLCIREDSGLISASDGELFFDTEGRPAEPLRDILNFLEQVSASGRLTKKLCELLDKHHLIQPWNIHVKGDDSEQKVQGLFRVDEALLNALPIAAFDELRQGGALPLVYCQLMSMQHLHTLGQMASQHAQQDAVPHTESGELDLEFLSNDGMIRYS